MLTLRWMYPLFDISEYDKCNDTTCQARGGVCYTDEEPNGNIHMNCETLYDKLEEMTNNMSDVDQTIFTETHENSLKLCNQSFYNDLNGIWVEAKGDLTRANTNSTVIKMARLLLLRRNCDYESVFSAINDFLKGKPKFVHNRFYDEVIISINNNLKIKDLEKSNKSIDLRLEELCLKRMLISLVKMCNVDCSRLEHFIQYQQIIKRNVEGYILGNDNITKFIFYDIIRSFVNDRKDSIIESTKYSTSEIATMTKFIEMLYTVCKGCLSGNRKNYSEYIYSLEFRSIHDNAAQQEYLQPLKDIYYKHSDDDKNILSSKEIAAMKYASKNPLIRRILTPEQERIIHAILVKDNKKQFKDLYMNTIPVLSHKYMHSPTSFFGIVFYDDNDYSQSSKHIMKILCYNGQTKYKKSLLEILTIWLDLLIKTPKHQPLWKFKLKDSDETVDIRDFKVDYSFEEDLQVFMIRSGSFKWYSNGYDLYKLQLFYQDLTFDEIVRYAIYSNYAIAERDFLLSQYSCLKSGLSCDCESETRQTN